MKNSMNTQTETATPITASRIKEIRQELAKTLATDQPYTLHTRGSLAVVFGRLGEYGIPDVL